MATFTKVTLSDGKPAMVVTGAGPTFWLRVRFLSKQQSIPQDGVRMKLMLRTQAYEVDSTGAPVLDGSGNPVVGIPVSETIILDALATGQLTTTQVKNSIRKQALEKFVGGRQAAEAIDNFPAELVE